MTGRYRRGVYPDRQDRWANPVGTQPFIWTGGEADIQAGAGATAIESWLVCAKTFPRFLIANEAFPSKGEAHGA
ncbi:MAG: hypothetical protein JWQ46_746 [Phenylobacterium sp.]|nr:hypothetical protein [Phenylobacterium sp.]